MKPASNHKNWSLHFLAYGAWVLIEVVHLTTVVLWEWLVVLPDTRNEKEINNYRSSHLHCASTTCFSNVHLHRVWTCLSIWLLCFDHWFHVIQDSFLSKNGKRYLRGIYLGLYRSFCTSRTSACYRISLRIRSSSDVKGPHTLSFDATVWAGSKSW